MANMWDAAVQRVRIPDPIIKGIAVKLVQFQLLIQVIIYTDTKGGNCHVKLAVAKGLSIRKFLDTDSMAA